jgi:hypothetical protein
MKDIAEEIRHIVNQASERLKKMKPGEVALKSTPEEWSKKEILGHLIDSAANNHQRIVRAGYNTADTYPPYLQNVWVQIQHYQESDWGELVELWTAYNRHLCHIIEYIPPEACSAPCNIGRDEPVSLEFVVKDYLRHLKHHMKDLMDDPK